MRRNANMLEAHEHIEAALAACDGRVSVFLGSVLAVLDEIEARLIKAGDIEAAKDLSAATEIIADAHYKYTAKRSKASRKASR